ncbi:MAG: lipocalin family protein [Flavobacteriaceae bacterium]|jgi:hypothetical protein|nr:lipocalin family protein [Flavobacteriaceae bacterium]
MKKLIVGILLFTVLIACNKDDDNVSSIVGTWKPDSIFLISGADGTVYQQIPLDDCMKQSTLQFTQDGKAISDSYFSDGTDCVHQGISTTDYTYNQSDHKLIIDGDEEYDVSELTQNKMVMDADTGLDLNGDGVNEFARQVLVK